MILKVATPGEWLRGVLSEFDSFLVDHAACERKASATALTFVSHYPDRPELVSAMIQLAREELDHFQRVYQQLAARGLQLEADTKDHYVLKMRDQVRRGPAFYLMDRLLVAGVVEARGCERFGMVAEALPAGTAKELYDTLSRSEAHHHQLFIGLARRYFPADEVADRLAELLEVEAEIIKQLPLRPALH
jgi:tRNA 2-(methylsulfanyl)-N6-isopentenyladenosine37 hydroxylase